VKVVQNLVSPSKYSIKCPYPMVAEFIVVHNTANDASARNEVAYMIRNNDKVSFHYAVDDKEIVQGIPENRNAWHAGDGANGQGNRKGLSIEICYSKSGGKRFEEAEKLAAKFIAYKLKEKGWGIDRVKKHQDFSGKYCPHRTLDMGWQRFLDMVKSEMEKGGDQDMLDKIVIYADGDIGAAITYSQSYGIPMVRATKDSLESVAKKYPAKITYFFGFDGKDTLERKYFSGKNRLETAKEALNS
jgi:N-acetylmuramoyl-L-alanine amidase CwlA